MKQSFPRARYLVGLSLIMALCSCARLPRQQAFATFNGEPVDTTRVVSAEKRFNINAASARDLEGLPGVGKVLAERIVAHRQRYGPFRRVEHLMMVRGISDHKFRAIRERVTVE